MILYSFHSCSFLLYPSPWWHKFGALLHALSVLFSGLVIVFAEGLEDVVHRVRSDFVLLAAVSQHCVNVKWAGKTSSRGSKSKGIVLSWQRWRSNNSGSKKISYADLQMEAPKGLQWCLKGELADPHDGLVKWILCYSVGGHRLMIQKLW